MLLGDLAEKKKTFMAIKNRIFRSLKNLTFPKVFLFVDSHAKRDLRARKFLARLHSPYRAW